MTGYGPPHCKEWICRTIKHIVGMMIGSYSDVLAYKFSYQPLGDWPAFVMSAGWETERVLSPRRYCVHSMTRRAGRDCDVA